MFFNFFSSLIAFAFPMESYQLLDLQPEETVCWELGDDSKEQFDVVIFERGRVTSADFQKIDEALKPGGRALLLLSPSDSWENKLFTSISDAEMLSIKEIKRELKKTGWIVSCFQIGKGARQFENEEALFAWALDEIAPKSGLPLEEHEGVALSYLHALKALEEKRTDVVIPYVQLIALVWKAN